MKKWHAFLPNWGISLFLILLIVLNLVSSFFELSILVKTITLLIVPILFLIYFFKQKALANVFFTILIFAFMGIVFSAFDGLELFSKFSESSFLGAYVLLVFVLIGKLKDIRFEGVVSWYLLFIFLVNAYLMYVMFSSVQDSFKDSVIFTLTISKGIALLIMGLLAFAIYLSQESEQSILFLTLVCCFVFSDVLNFITTMHIDFWAFAAFHKILQSIGLLLFVMYVYNYHQQVKIGVKPNKSNAVASTNQVTVQS
ncbi:hypothetical protein [Gelidibacter mesophilus]|uniref:hypothetical protein n=1 Tax=Gelidibacter mesophilus TaxID=169050 RepID=UPI00040AE5CD|nr:hypothetical protein [Gelidibacter mesophilus]